VRLVIAIALLFSVTPGMSEVVEVSVHVVLHGDLPRHDDATGYESGCAEHTCTPLAHHCSCHVTMSAQATSRTVTTSGLCDVTRMDPSVVATVSGRSCGPPPLRPPIA
jgi:hypothetical protein